VQAASAVNAWFKKWNNFQIQAENLQAAESRISDVDVATEMTEFVRKQVLAQATTNAIPSQ
jgi:flagellin-like hook-associated protein FlgL